MKKTKKCYQRIIHQLVFHSYHTSTVKSETFCESVTMASSQEQTFENGTIHRCISITLQHEISAEFANKFHGHKTCPVFAGNLRETFQFSKFPIIEYNLQKSHVGLFGWKSKQLTGFALAILISA